MVGNNELASQDGSVLRPVEAGSRTRMKRIISHENIQGSRIMSADSKSSSLGI